MMLTRWDPFKEMTLLRGGINRLFDDSFRGRYPETEFLSTWTPAVDIHENENEIVITAEVPGMEQKDIDIEVTGNVLTIRGEKKTSKEVKEEQYHRTERVYGSFQRSFSLPDSVNAGKVTAGYKDGVLSVTIPRAPETKPKKISVAVG